MTSMRYKAFHSLRPVCVDLSQTLKKTHLHNTTGQNVIEKLDALQTVLVNITETPQCIDRDLAEYVFFPLSRVFKMSELLPLRALTVAVQCVMILLRTGWAYIEDADLATQILVLLAILAGKNLSNKNAESERLSVQVYSCMSMLFQTVNKSPPFVKSSFLKRSDIPAIGHAVTVMLDGAKLGFSRDTQTSALEAYNSFQTNVATSEVTSSFLPGIVSALTKILAPSTQLRRSYKVLSGAIDALALVLKSVNTETALHSASDDIPYIKTPSTRLVQASEKIHMALTEIVKLQTHSRLEVRAALYRLCFFVVKDCRDFLSHSMALVLETCIFLCAKTRHENSYETLLDLVTSDSSLLRLLKSSLYDWIRSIPRTLNGMNNAKREHLIEVISNTLRELARRDVDLSLIYEHLELTLKGCLSETLGVTPKEALVTNLSHVTLGNIKLSDAQLDFEVDTSSPKDFIPLFDSTGTLQVLLKDVIKILASVGSQGFFAEIARNSLAEIQFSRGTPRIISFLMLLNLLTCKNNVQSTAQNPITTQFIEVCNEDIFDELYTTSINIVTTSLEDEGDDWRLQVLALKFFEFQAARKEARFRTDLIDTIFPVINLVASNKVALREQALHCLNSIAASCRYETTKELVLLNVDYIINALTGRFSVLNITPSSCQVLHVIIGIFGSSLIPYLEDIVDNLFEALERFHGYPEVLRQLFFVLNTIVEQYAPFFCYQSDPQGDERHAIEPSPSTAFTMLIMWFSNHYSKECVSNSLSPTAQHSSSQNVLDPEAIAQPVGNCISTLHSNQSEHQSKRRSGSTFSQKGGMSLQPQCQALRNVGTKRGPNSSKNNDTLYKILYLAQHHLPSSSPSVRASLLSLLDSGLPYLAGNEDRLLPLVHDLWPVLCSRLADNENYVVARILNVMAIMCKETRYFMRSRIQSLWPTIVRVHERVKLPVERFYTSANLAFTSPILSLENSLVPTMTRIDHSGASISRIKNVAQCGSDILPMDDRYIRADISTLTDALETFLFSILRNVGVTDTMYNQIVTEMVVSKRLLKAQNLRMALRIANADAFWLSIQIKGRERNEKLSGLEFGKPPIRLQDSIEFVIFELRNSHD